MVSINDAMIITGGLFLFTAIAYLRIRVRSSLRFMIVANLMTVVPIFIIIAELDSFTTLISILSVTIVGILYLAYQYDNQIGLPYRRMYAAMVRAEDNKNLDVQSTLDTKITGEMQKLQNKQVQFIFNIADLVKTIKIQKENMDNYISDLDQTEKRMEEEIGTVTNDIDKILQTAALISEQVEEIRSQGLNLIDRTDSDFNILTEVSNAAGRVTDQTNIIAVNAAIEAAHTEVEGTNFSTVAEGIQAISKRSRDTSEKLNSTILDLRRSLIREIGNINSKLDKLEDRIFELGELANRSSSFAHQQQSFLGEIRDITKQVESASDNIGSKAKMYSTD